MINLFLKGYFTQYTMQFFPVQGIYTMNQDCTKQLMPKIL